MHGFGVAPRLGRWADIQRGHAIACSSKPDNGFTIIQSEFQFLHNPYVPEITPIRLLNNLALSQYRELKLENDKNLCKSKHVPHPYLSRSCLSDVNTKISTPAASKFIATNTAVHSSAFNSCITRFASSIGAKQPLDGSIRQVKSSSHRDKRGPLASAKE